MRIITSCLLTVTVLLIAGSVFAQDTTGVKELPDLELVAKYDTAMRTKNYQDALIYIRELMERHEKSVDYRYKFANTTLLMANLQAADPEFERVLELDPNYLEAYLGQAIIYARQNNEKAAMDKMLDAARKGYPVRDMQAVPELRRYLAGNVRFFLKMVEADVPRVEHTRDPFLNPLRVKRAETGEGGEQPEELPEIVEGDPEPIQRDKMIKMKDLLVLIQQALAAGEEEEARLKFQQFRDLYRDVELGRITKKEYNEQMTETWKVAQETVYPRLRKIELRKFREEVRAGLDKLYEDYKNQNIEAARQHNEEIINMLDPKLKSSDAEFVALAKQFDQEREELFNRIKILEEFQKNVRPFLRLTATIIRMNLKQQVHVALLETVFGGEVKKSSLGVSDSLPRMNDFIVLRIEEDRLVARYKGEQVEVLMGTGFGSSESP